MASFDDGPSEASKAMLSAALGGLLSLGTTSGCVFSVFDGGAETSSSATSTTGSAGGSTSTTAGAGGSNATASGPSSSEASSTVASTVSASGSASTTASGTATASTGTGSTNPHTPIPDTACPDGIVPNPQVLMSTVVALTQPEFQSLCDQAGGIFEIQPLCGGSNACRGFAYDSGTQTYTQHSCQHTNTCAGYNCVVCG